MGKGKDRKGWEVEKRELEVKAGIKFKYLGKYGWEGSYKE